MREWLCHPFSSTGLRSPCVFVYCHHNTRSSKKTLQFTLTEKGTSEESPENELVQGKADHIHEVTGRRKENENQSATAVENVPHRTQPQSRRKQQSNTLNRIK